MQRSSQRNTRHRVFTVNGQAELVIQSADAYQKLLDDQQLLESIRSIGRGLEQAKRGEVRPIRDFLETIASEHGISLT